MQRQKIFIGLVRLRSSLSLVLHRKLSFMRGLFILFFLIHMCIHMYNWLVEVIPAYINVSDVKPPELLIEVLRLIFCHLIF